MHKPGRAGAQLENFGATLTDFVDAGTHRPAGRSMSHLASGVGGRHQIHAAAVLRGAADRLERRGHTDIHRHVRRDLEQLVRELVHLVLVLASRAGRLLRGRLLLGHDLIRAGGGRGYAVGGDVQLVVPLGCDRRIPGDIAHHDAVFYNGSAVADDRLGTRVERVLQLVDGSPGRQ